MALGFSDGSLLVMETPSSASISAFSLTASKSSVYFLAKEAHRFPVTGLAIDLPKATLLSSSADGQILVNRISTKPISMFSPARSLFYFVIFCTLIVLLLAIFLADKLSAVKWNEIEDFDSFYKLFPTDIHEL
jgi:hypothetical protein